MQKPVHEVFEAIADPSKMSNYFISKSSGKMEEGKELIWKFPKSELRLKDDVTLNFTCPYSG